MVTEGSNVLPLQIVMATSVTSGGIVSDQSGKDWREAVDAYDPLCLVVPLNARKFGRYKLLTYNEFEGMNGAYSKWGAFPLYLNPEHGEIALSFHRAYLYHCSDPTWSLYDSIVFRDGLPENNEIRQAFLLTVRSNFGCPFHYYRQQDIVRRVPSQQKVFQLQRHFFGLETQ
jgi:hypothetical protein